MFNINMSNSELINHLKLFARTKIRPNKKCVYLDPTINIKNIYIFYLKDRKYFKLHYMYLYWINLNLVDKYD